jgi:hypothetical protein
MVGIAIPAYKRSLHKILAPLLEQDVSDIKLYISLDTNGDTSIASFDELSNYEIIFRGIEFEQEVTGIVANTFNALDMAFKDGCEYVMYLEDDLILSKDAIDLMYFYIEQTLCNGLLWEHASLCLCNLEEGSDPSALFFSQSMIGWGFVIHRATFEKIKDAWFTPPMWDHSVARHLREIGHTFIFPEVSRVKHIGVDGTHVQNEVFNQELQKNMKFYEGRDGLNYYFK